MGTPVPDPPIEYGNDCLACTPPAGDLWLPDHTPEYVFVYFAELEKCPAETKQPPNGRTFKLKQSPWPKCLWEYEGPTWDVYWWSFDPGDNKSHLHLRQHLSDYHLVAEDVPCPEEGQIYTNERVDCGVLPGSINGYGIVGWTEAVLDLIEAFNIDTSSQVMHEVFKTPEEKLVHKICRVKDATNIKFLME